MPSIIRGAVNKSFKKWGSFPTCGSVNGTRGTGLTIPQAAGEALDYYDFFRKFHTNNYHSYMHIVIFLKFMVGNGQNHGLLRIIFLGGSTFATYINKFMSLSKSADIENIYVGKD